MLEPYSLQDELDELMDTIPCIHTHNFNSQRDLQDFTERDFDRRLKTIQVQALLDISESLAQLGSVSLEEVLSAVDIGTRVS